MTAPSILDVFEELITTIHEPSATPGRRRERRS
jgi:hypothetical protein